MSDPVRPHRWQPSRLPRPWDSPEKSTGVGYHFLLQCMKVKSESQVAQSCPTLSNPMVHSLPGSSVHGIFQARVLEWGAIAFSKATKVPSKILREWKLLLWSEKLESQVGESSFSCFYFLSILLLGLRRGSIFRKCTVEWTNKATDFTFFHRGWKSESQGTGMYLGNTSS